MSFALQATTLNGDGRRARLLVAATRADRALRRLAQRAVHSARDVPRRRLCVERHSRLGRRHRLCSATSTRSRAASTASSSSGTSARPNGRSRRASSATSASKDGKDGSPVPIYPAARRPDRQGPDRQRATADKIPHPHAQLRPRPKRSTAASSPTLPADAQLLQRGLDGDQLHRPEPRAARTSSRA